MKELKIPIKVVNKRALFTSFYWDDLDLDFCVHGLKLRWSCDYCEELFNE